MLGLKIKKKCLQQGCISVGCVPTAYGPHGGLAGRDVYQVPCLCLGGGWGFVINSQLGEPCVHQVPSSGPYQVLGGRGGGSSGGQVPVGWVVRIFNFGGGG